MGSGGVPRIEADRFEGKMIQSDWDIASLRGPQAVQEKGSTPG